MTAEAAFHPFPVLNTERLSLREMRLDDAEAFFAIKSDPEVTQNYGQEPHQSLEETQTWIEKRLPTGQPRDFIFWTITLKGDDTLIGSLTLWNLDKDFHCGEIGYELHPAHERKGIMTEAASAVLTWGFTELGLHRIEATPFADNTASKSLLLKLGFTHEGTLIQRHFFRGRYLDQLYYGLLKNEWLRST